ncbi:MAG: hypothetical protein OXB88_09165, partial [Bacteriovoracales bacterium]|nr:hypothetical protein [Bacteriovoracales bacterium]
MSKSILPMILSAIFLTSCGEQDPLKEFPESVQEAVPLSQKLERPPSAPITTDSMVIDVNPEVVNFTEGMEGRFHLSGRLIGVEGDYELKLSNPPEGMSFDPATETVVWTPPFTAVTGEDTYSKYLVDVDLIAYGERETLSIRKSIPIFVNIASPPLSKHLLGIVSNPRKLEFFEGKEKTFRLLGQLYGEVKAPYTVEVLNLPPGAVPKSIEGGVEVTWTPPTSMVTGDNYFTSYDLKVAMTAVSDDGEVSIEREIPLGISVASTPLAARWLEIGVESSDPGFTERGEVEFVEGKEGRFRLVGHLLGGVVADYKIEVLNPPKGAKVTTSSKGGVEFAWSPGTGVVTGENTFTSVYSLEVKLTASDEGIVVVKTKT